MLRISITISQKHDHFHLDSVTRSPSHPPLCVTDPLLAETREHETGFSFSECSAGFVQSKTESTDSLNVLQTRLCGLEVHPFLSVASSMTGMFFLPNFRVESLLNQVLDSLPRSILLSAASSCPRECECQQYNFIFQKHMVISQKHV